MSNIGIFTLLALVLQLQQVYATLCPVYPTEYAYHESVSRHERVSANCAPYTSGLQRNVFTEKFINCNGMHFRLADTEYGSEQYNSSDYYVWNAETEKKQILFIFPTRVNLTIITLHYYSDNIRGLSELRFYTVPDHFNVWDALSASYDHADIAAVSPGGESKGPKNVTINCNFNTRKVAMTIRSDFEFGVSEVEFSTCNGTTTTSDNTLTITSLSSDLRITTSPDFIFRNHTTVDPELDTLDVNTTATQSVEIFSTSPNNLVDSRSQLNIVLPVVLTAATVITIVVVVVLALLLLLYCKRHRRIKTSDELDNIYSTLDRETKEQKQPHSINGSDVLYDQIQLSPFTGQSEPISTTNSESKVVSCFPLTRSTSQLHNCYTEKTHESDTDKSGSAYATYAVVDKKKIDKSKSDETKEKPQSNLLETNNYPPTNTVSRKDGDLGALDEIQKSKSQKNERKENLEEMYAVVQKKPKKHGEQKETAPPVPLHTIECLYTAVQKKSK